MNLCGGIGLVKKSAKESCRVDVGLDEGNHQLVRFDQDVAHVEVAPLNVLRPRVKLGIVREVVSPFVVGGSIRWS